MIEPIKKRVTYVVLTWNSERYIIDCLDAVFHITEVYNHVIVIDNGSTDGTLNLLKNYKMNNPADNRLEIIFLEKNYGTTKSRNMGLRKVEEESEYICILDSDTKINKTAILGLIEALKTEPNVGLVGPKMVNSLAEVQISGRKFPTAPLKLFKALPSKILQKKGEEMEKHAVEANTMHDVDYLMSACWVMKREIVEKIGYFDEKIFYAPEDVDYCMRIRQQGYRVLFCPNVTIVHEWQRLSKKKMISKINFEHIKGLIYFFCKYRYLFNPQKARKLM